MNRPPKQGFVLTELLVAGLLSVFLMLGLVQMAAGAGRGLSLIESLSDNQQGGRFAIEQVRAAVMSAGFSPVPWEDDPGPLGVVDGSVDGGPNGDDVLVVTQLSDRNCFGNPNEALDTDNRPAFYLRQSRFEVNSSRNLAHTCHYGPQDGELIRQINRNGLVAGVESFQVLYAEDTDDDALANRMVRGGNWSDISRVTGIRVGILVASGQIPGDAQGQAFGVLDQSLMTAGDGRLRQVWTATIPLFSKLR